MKRFFPMKLTVLAMLFIVGCHSAPVPYYANDIIPENYYAKGFPSVADANGKFTDKEAGTKYCQRVATNADIRSQHYLFWGILGSVLASGAVLAGTAMGPDDDDDANWAQKNRNTIVLGSGALVAVPSTVFLMLSKNNAEASAGATAGLAESDDDSARKMCIAARNRMVRSRINAADYVQSSMQKTLSDFDKQQSQIEEAIGQLEADLKNEKRSDQQKEIQDEISDLKAQLTEIVKAKGDILLKNYKSTKASDAATPPTQNNSENPNENGGAPKDPPSLPPAPQKP